MAENQTSGNRPPEKQIRVGDCKIAIWPNRFDRSIKIGPRSYRDPATNEFKETPYFRAGDLPALIYALQLAQDYCFNTPAEQTPQAEQEPI